MSARPYASAMIKSVYFLMVVSSLLATGLGDPTTPWPLTDGSSSMDDFLVALLENIKVIMKEGKPEYNIPVLDPYNFTYRNLKDENIYQLDLSVQGTLSNFSSFDINKLHFDSDLNTILNLTFHDITFDGSYDLTWMVKGIIPIVGEGPIYLYFGELSIGIVPVFHAGSGYLSLKSFNFSYNESNFQCVIDGLLKEKDISEVLKYLIFDVLSTAIIKIKPDLEGMLTSFIMTNFNMNNKGMTIFNIIEAFRSIF